ncbi:Cytochrome bo(3) ubiquinol oxidase subunit 1 [Linum perenne]
MTPGNLALSGSTSRSATLDKLSNVRIAAPQLPLGLAKETHSHKARPVSPSQDLALLPLAVALSGCNYVVLAPAGDIAAQQRDLVIISTVLMLLIVVPVMALTVLFAWRYRQSNSSARYEPDWDHSTKLELVIWSAPLLIIVCLGALTWMGTHLLDPYRTLGRIHADRAIDQSKAALEVDVVALDWKWLFIYPDYGIATVNDLAAPVDRPINFRITASSVMNSFYIPALAGQIYAMPGMETKLHAVGLDDKGFDAWVAQAKSAGGSLGRAEYLQLEKPSENEPVRRWGTVESDLYRLILNMCVETGKMCQSEMMAIDAKGGNGHEGPEQHPAALLRQVRPPRHRVRPRACFRRRHLHAGCAAGADDRGDQGAARHRAAHRRRSQAADLLAAEVLLLLPRTTSEIRLLKRARMSPDLLKLIFGRLGIDSLPLHEPILVGTFAVVALGGITLLAGVTYFRLWGYLWREWFTSVDHKRIGVMYMILGIVMLAARLRRRPHDACAAGTRVFTAHGVIMIFFVAMPLVTGLMNFVVPLQIGARDVSFPFLNNFSFWMTVGGAVLVMLSLFIGEFARTGWLAYPPLSNIGYSPDVGVDYYIWGLQVAGVGTTLSGINLICTIVKLRCPGMTMMRMPVFTWTSLCTNILIVASFPVLTVVLALLSLDRYVGTNFFTNDFGGSPMMYVNLIWIWGHPEVYILVLPAFGIFSEVTSTFSGKRLFGYTSMVYATVVITILSYLVWLHHFFTMGSGASVNSFFGITTMIISIPTGAKMFNWLFTMYRGRIRYELPMMWTIAFMLTFVIGGMTGVLLAVPPADFVLHNSLFLIAHFHNVIIGGVVFGAFAGISYWFPKAFGFRLDPFWGKMSFWFWVTGFYMAFMPLYVLGPDGCDPPPARFAVSFLKREQLRDVTGDPWDARTLEWATSSPPPDYNFAFTPVVHDNDAWWDMKKRGYQRPLTGFKPIHMPSSTGTGIILAGFATAMGFGLIWYIWWLAALSFIALLAVGIGHTFNYHRDFDIPADDVIRTEDARTKLLAGAK